MEMKISSKSGGTKSGPLNSASSGTSGGGGMYGPTKTKQSKQGPVRTIVSPPPVDNPDRTEMKINVRNLLAAAATRHQPGNQSPSRISVSNVFTGQASKNSGPGARPSSAVSDLFPEYQVSASDRSRNNSLSPSTGMPVISRNGSVASAYGCFSLQVPTTNGDHSPSSGGGHSSLNGDLRGLESGFLMNRSVSGTNGGGGGRGGVGGSGGRPGGKPPNTTHSSSSPQEKWKSFSTCVSTKVCAIPLKKLFFGMVLMCLVTVSWVGATHLLKSTYTSLHEEIMFGLTNHSWEGSTNLTTRNHLHYTFDAPLFTTWFCSMGTIFFLPFYLSCQMCCRGNPGVSTNHTMDTHSKDANVRARTTPKSGRNGIALSGTGNGNMSDGPTIVGPKRVGVAIILKESIQNLREKGFTFGKFVGRCSLFSLLWMLTNYLYIYSLRILGCTEVMALFATNICFIYLLSWVVLHEQFVGIRIVAVILGNTGIALLAYMDGINQTPTLGAVVLAAAASAGSAIYRVLFKRVMGEVTFCQVAIFFSMIGLCTTILFWPLMLTLVLTGVETLEWNSLPWFPLVGSLVLSLVANLLANFGIVVTYETFITLGLILAVPACAALDIHWYGATFDGMKLAGIVMICFGFVIVLFPSNWPNCIHSIIRLGRRGQKNREMGRKPLPDLRTGHLGSRLRSPSGRVK